MLFTMQGNINDIMNANNASIKQSKGRVDSSINTGSQRTNRMQLSQNNS